MKTIRLFLLAFSLLTASVAKSQTYSVPGAQIQPAWVFPLWFEDFNGDKDTLYFCYDPSSTAADVFWEPDTVFGERIIPIDTSRFNATILYLNPPNFWGWKTVVVPGLYNVYVYFTKGRMPLKVKWDRNLFYDPVLLDIPVPNLLPHPLIQILSFCSDFDPGYNNCPTAWPLTFIPEDPLGLFPNGYVTDSMVFWGDTVGVNSNVSFFTLPLQFEPYHGLLSVPTLNDHSVSVYPNPVSHQLIVSVANGHLERVSIYDAVGRMVLESEVRASRFTADAAFLPAGLYTVRVRTYQGISHHKLIKH